MYCLLIYISGASIHRAWTCKVSSPLPPLSGKTRKYLSYFMSTQQGVMPPPPGVEPNFVSPENHYYASTTALIMRLYTRRFVIQASLGIDD
ncbi:uncharacterized protein BDW43DRAFT_261009 [Aspergillus alliaceus]|uniref:uncharacterized protein n=1 Tax=Petromyces alliaceus TaxID=209559 RepID=UPI0012A3BB88|nr:uncharacterized protein BDW43DRAFT_261009 [Aspergillus alliaceus]KAB8239244.1 hypothetical protein BDW43DRAFT_261009 [Aspergillus alliaceus]